MPAPRITTRAIGASSQHRSGSTESGSDADPPSRTGRHPSWSVGIPPHVVSAPCSPVLDGVDNGDEPSRGLVGKVGELLPGHELPGVGDRHMGAGLDRLEHHVAGKEQAHRRVDLKSAVGEDRIAGAQDLEWRPVDLELLLEGGGPVSYTHLTLPT